MFAKTLSPPTSTESRGHAQQGMATVVDVVQLGAETFLLDVTGGPAVRAASCLLKPEMGDRVWYVREGDESFVTAVLSRAQPDATARLEVDSNAELRCEGRLNLRGQTVAVEADDALEVKSQRAQVVLQEASVFAKSVVSHVARSTWVGSVVERMVDRFMSHSKSSTRIVEDLDQLQARNFDHKATDNASVSAERVFLHGRSIVKADGDQIHIG